MLSLRIDRLSATNRRVSSVPFARIKTTMLSNTEHLPLGELFLQKVIGSVTLSRYIRVNCHLYGELFCAANKEFQQHCNFGTYFIYRYKT